MVDIQQLERSDLIRMLSESQAALNADAREERRLLHELHVHQIELELQNRELRQAQLELEAARDRYSDLYDFAPVSYVTLDAKGVILELNLTACAMLGGARDALQGQPLVTFVEQADRPQLFQHLRHCRASGNNKTVSEFVLTSRTGDVHQVRLESVAGTLDDGTPICRSAIIDVSEQVAAEKRLRYQAHHDSLTGLPNRALLNDWLLRSLHTAQRHQNKVAVIYLDLDHFKLINDSLGHALGDHLLAQVATRLQQALRVDDIVARIGGDEFVLVLVDIQCLDDVLVLVDKLIVQFHEAFLLQDHEIRTTASLGISLFPQDGDEPSSLLSNADAAMYQAKDMGRNTYAFYTRELTAHAFERVLLENNLHQAIEKNELRLYYQPQIDLQSGETVGMEALIRWQHPDMGLIAPDQFIPLAEECGLISSIGAWVLNTACRQGRMWLDSGCEIGKIAVNLAGDQIRRGDLVMVVSHALEQTGFPPQKLELEITESFIMIHSESAIAQLNELCDMGITLSIDDFGTGYSSLSYLKQLPVHKLKIDKSFVRDIPDDRDDMAIAQLVIAMGKILGLTVIAEGVETRGQEDFLRQAGCQQAQGYLYSRPVDVDGIPAFLNRRPE